MATWEIGLCADQLKIYQGVTQGDPILPKILNVVVEAVIRRGGGGRGYGSIRQCRKVDILLFIYGIWYPCVNAAGMSPVGVWNCWNMNN